MHRSLTRFATILLAVAAAAACSRSEAPRAAASPASTAPRVTDIQVGRSISADKTVVDKVEVFQPTDTIYVAVKTEGAAPSAKLQTRWSYQDKVVEESSDTIAPRGPAVTEFHLSKPDGWPVGSYKIEVILNGTPVGTKSFEVKPTAD